MRIYVFGCSDDKKRLDMFSPSDLEQLRRMSPCEGCTDAPGGAAFRDQVDMIIEGRALGVLPRPA